MMSYIVYNLCKYANIKICYKCIQTLKNINIQLYMIMQTSKIGNNIYCENKYTNTLIEFNFSS